jgi:hypothetical protein
VLLLLPSLLLPKIDNFLFDRKARYLIVAGYFISLPTLSVGGVIGGFSTHDLFNRHHA